MDYDALEKRLRELYAAATPGNLSTAERHITSEWIECPVCNGNGEVEAADYCNFDHKALGVQFYGIGDEFGAHERLWSAVMKDLPALLDAIADLRARNEALVKANGILEDALQEVGDDYPGSSCQEWCQQQVKAARAALAANREG